MKTYSRIIKVLIIIASSLLLGCNDIVNIKFDKVKWDSVGDIHSYPYRERMLKDLTTHHQLKGLTYKQLIDSLGQSDNYYQDLGDSIRYDIVVDYGYLDPKSGTYLAIGFNKDSIATGFKVVKWKNRHANE